MFVNLNLNLHRPSVRLDVDGTYCRVAAGQRFAECFAERRPAQCAPVWAFRRSPGSIEVEAGRWAFSLDWGRVAPKEPYDAIAGV